MRARYCTICSTLFSTSINMDFSNWVYGGCVESFCKVSIKYFEGFWWLPVGIELKFHHWIMIETVRSNFLVGFGSGLYASGRPGIFTSQSSLKSPKLEYCMFVGERSVMVPKQFLVLIFLNHFHTSYVLLKSNHVQPSSISSIKINHVSFKFHSIQFNQEQSCFNPILSSSVMFQESWIALNHISIKSNQV